jgi:hypothetical protein
VKIFDSESWRTNRISRGVSRALRNTVTAPALEVA